MKPWRELLGPAGQNTDLEPIESRLFDGRTHELAYRPTLHRA